MFEQSRFAKVRVYILNGACDASRFGVRQCGAKHQSEFGAAVSDLVSLPNDKKRFAPGV